MPQGGVLSPLLWLVHFDVLAPRLNVLRTNEPETFEGVSAIDLIYADDVASILYHKNSQRLLGAAKRNAELLMEVLVQYC